MKKATGIKRGRPRKNKQEESIFIGMQMTKGLARNLSKDAEKHFRNRAQHILWILTSYIVKTNLGMNTSSFKPKDNQPIYTEKEIEEMYKQYKKENE